MSIPLLQTGPLRALAASLRDDAERLRRLASTLTATAEHTEWQSVAADACRGRLAAFGAALLRLAAQLEDASADVARHLVTAQRRSDELVAAAAQALGNSVLDGSVLESSVLDGAVRGGAAALAGAI